MRAGGGALIPALLPLALTAQTGKAESLEALTGG